MSAIPSTGTVLRVKGVTHYSGEGLADVCAVDATGVKLHLRFGRKTHWFDWHPSSRGGAVLKRRGYAGDCFNYRVVES